MPSLSMLVVDDEPPICQLILQWLEPLGHTVASAANGAEAIKRLRAERFDLVVTDILMPESDGLELIEELKKAQPAAHILAISGGGRYMDTSDCLRMARGLGADAAIMKPFVKEKFIEAMKCALAPRPASGASRAPFVNPAT